MKKIFTLAAAVLASFSLWAVDPSYQSSEWAKQADAEAALGKHGNVTLAQSGFSYGNLGSNGSFYYVAAGQNLKASETWKYFSIVADENYFIDSVSVWYCENGSNETNVAWIGWGEGETPATKSLAHGETAGTKGSKKLADAKWVTIDAHTYDIQTMYISRKIQGFQDEEGNKISDFGKGQTFNILGFKIWLRKGCSDPEFTVPEGGTGFVGDPIDLAITSKNNSKPVNYAVTVDGVKGVSGTDYSFNVSPGLVQATPLKAGTFVITFSQASDGTYCDAEDSATFVISAKNPVTSFEIDAPATAHIGEEVTIELKNFDAAPTEIVWYDGALTEITAANGKTSYTFTPEATGKYAFQITAWNEYNELNDKASNYTQINVVVGTDASLSDLKVNGATLGDFATNKYEYAIGEFGVYEAINVTATAADAPYATVEVVDDKAGTITVTVTAEDKTTTQNYVMTYTRKAATALVPVSESTTWDWTECGETADLQLSDATMPKKTEEFNFADLLKNPGENFKAASLEGIMEYVYRKQSDYKFCQGTQLRFVTTVAGKLEVVYSNTGTRSKETERRFLVVNGKSYGEGTMNATPVTTSNIAVVAGEVVISSIINDGKETASMLRFNKVVFTKDDSSTALDNTEAEVKAVKVVRDGQLLILKNGVLYNAQGAVVK